MKRVSSSLFLTALAFVPMAHASSAEEISATAVDVSSLSIDAIMNESSFAQLPRDNPMLDLLRAIEWYKSQHPQATPGDIDRFIVESQRGAEDLSGVYEQWTHLTASEKALVVSSPGNAALTVMTKDKAFELTTTHMGRNGLGDRSDAFRHAIWNALMSRYISKLWASSYATAHEDKTEAELNQIAADGYGERQHRAMDLHNNEKGRDCWSVFTDTMITTSDDDLVGRVRTKLNKGELTYLHD